MRRVGGSGAVGDLPDVADLVWAAEHLCALEVVRMSNDGTPRRLGHCGDSEGRGDLAGVYEAGRWCARGADGGNEDERGGGVCYGIRARWMRFILGARAGIGGCVPRLLAGNLIGGGAFLVPPRRRVGADP